MKSLRYKLLLFIFIGVWGLLTLNLFILSVKNQEYYEKLAERNMTKKEFLVPTRGNITDRNHEFLAINELVFGVFLPSRLKQKELLEKIEVIQKFFPNFSKETLLNNYQKENSLYNHNLIKVVGFIPYATMQPLYTKLIQNQGIFVRPLDKRYYPNNALASHVLGYVGVASLQDLKDDEENQYSQIVGKTGIEKEYNKLLQGKVGYKIMHVNALNQELATLEVVPPSANNHLQLSLDKRLQKEADKLFENKRGAILVMNAENGELLVAGSYPEYNLNDFVGGISQDKWQKLQDDIYNPLLNRFANALYPPGSVVKMGVGLSFLENLNITENTTIPTPPFIEVGKRKFRDWKKTGHGNSNLYKAIRESVDVYFYKFGLEISIEKLSKTLREVGFGEKTGVDLPNEFVGIVPDNLWKLKRFNQDWRVGDTLITAIGQGSFLATPLQVLVYTGLIATGKLATPHFAINNQQPLKDPLNSFQKKKLQALRVGMYEVCNHKDGTAYHSTRGSKVTLACKTGTAQVVEIAQNIVNRMKEKDMEYFHRSHAWITAFLPYEKPKYAITILVEHGEGGSKLGGLLVKMSNKLYELGYL
ncbi:penicillin-binding protein 2 [Helicobacter pylori]|uniref:Penicillin-binding protein 2 n=1 Tax=Helicobacter pylori TaxID=210 RepID=A0AB36KDK8_HELPX|nr:penicillin-binding protein 2 [Helicobacter pylori]OOP96419.1 penicillin-binding protein 2 [Helicobacter pylori]PDW84551.1 penicillin-binding protein 2 [Helicobacter pylori]WQU56497.1 penicillin-binding protein 2 [Helicobacter pylori]